MDEREPAPPTVPVRGRERPFVPPAVYAMPPAVGTGSAPDTVPTATRAPVPVPVPVPVPTAAPAAGAVPRPAPGDGRLVVLLGTGPDHRRGTSRGGLLLAGVLMAVLALAALLAATLTAALPPALR